MRYMGGKFRIAKHILPIILKDRKDGQWYVEPFCGGCNTLSEVTGPRIGADSRYYLIVMWEAVSLGWIPPETVSELLYNTLKGYVKQNQPTTSPLYGYVGLAASFGGTFYGSYAKPSIDKRRGTVADCIKWSYNSALRQFPKLKNVIFKHCSYEDLKIPENSIIYCDPPYEGVGGYGNSFNNAQFWEQCRNWVFDGHKVFVSEYNAPSDWVCVWSKEQQNSIRGYERTSTSVEKLFVHESQLEGVE